MRVTIGHCDLDVEARQLFRGGEPVHLSPKAFALLELLVAQRPRAIPRQELYDYLWPDTFVVEANLPILIGEVRAALGDEGKELIRTVHRHGYACTVPSGGSRSKAPHLLVCGEREYPLHPGENLVGRDETAVVRLGSTTVSRRHSMLTVDGETVTLTDLRSKNGTRVNGVAVTVPHPLEDGEVVEFGKVEMVYRRELAQLPTETSY